MAITLSSILDFPGSLQGTGKRVPGATLLFVAELLGDASYPTGGYAVTPALLNVNQIRNVIPMTTNSGFFAGWDQVNQKVKLFQQPAVAAAGQSPEVTAATNVSTIKIYVLVEAL